MGARTRGFANNVLTSGKIDATDGLTGNLASANFANATVTNVEELPPAVGSAISSVAGNPAAPVAEGKIWYNTSTDSFNVAPVLEAWSSGANMISAKRFLGGAGTQTSALAFGGQPSPTNPSEEYNGSGWSTGGDLNTARKYLAGCGTQTAGLGFGGNISPITGDTEEYNGSTWSEQNNLNTARAYLAGMGIQTAGLAAGGRDAPSTLQAATEEYDGTSWTEQNDMSTARRFLGGAGTQTAGLVFGGGTPNSDLTEEYDGTSWTAGGTMNTARRYLSGFGIQTSAIAFGGGTAVPVVALTTTEQYDGSTWTTSSASLATARGGTSGAGTQSAGLAIGGFSPDFGTAISNTEEYNQSINVITAGAWASGGNLNTGRASLGGAGSQTAALAFGGTVFTPATPSNPFKNESEEYNGTSWTEGNNLNQARSGSVGAGTQTAAIGAGGIPGSGASNTANSEEYDGTSWAEGNNLVNASYSRAGAGTQTATILMGGGNYTNPPPSFNYISNTEYYDGTSWSEQNDMNTARYVVAGCGSQTSSLVSGGIASPGTVTNVEEWNGTSWSEVNDLIVANYGHALTGIQTAALQAAGNTGSVTAAAFNYNGTSWTTAPSVATARQSLAGGGEGSTQTSSIIFGGHISPAPTGYQQTEEFTGETSALNVESLTTS